MSFRYNESKKPEKLLIFELKIRKRSRVREFETKDQSIARKDLSHYPPRVQQLVPMPLQDLLAQMNINGEFEFGSDSDE